MTHYKKIAFLSLLIALSVTFTSLPLHANEASNWEKDKASLKTIINDENLSNVQRCDQTWDILWSWSKKGNYEARGRLMFYFMSLPHQSIMIMPNGAETRVKDAVILAAHSLHDDVSKIKEKGVAYSADESTTAFALMLLSDDSLKMAFPNWDGNDFRDEQILRCIAYKGIFDEPVQECIAPAVEKGLLPSFEDYAAEIDEAIAAGKKVKCVFDR